VNYDDLLEMEFALRDIREAHNELAESLRHAANAVDALWVANERMRVVRKYGSATYLAPWGRQVGLSEVRLQQLKTAGYHFVEQLVDAPKYELLDIRGFGQKAFAEVTSAVVGWCEKTGRMHSEGPIPKAVES
jgi:DNA-directed RNA polymerase alpha subunit